jgi:hypothetical protein
MMVGSSNALASGAAGRVPGPEVDGVADTMIEAEARLWKFERARSLTILSVYPVDKIVQSMWKNFLPLFATFQETVITNFSKSYRDLSV